MLSGMLHLMSPLHRERIDAEMREKGGSCIVIDSKVVTLTNVLNGAGVTHVDLLSIDTEGSELQVCYSSYPASPNMASLGFRV
jgi:hypothetical protein